VADPDRVPDATYRLQLRPEFGFADATNVASYLAELGVSHAYTSPFLQAAAGSTHGYDGVDPTRVSDELGGPLGFEQFRAALRRAGLRLVVDIVPNHLSTADPRNLWWYDVLRHGRGSEFATYFDIDWDGPQPALADKVLLPVLGHSLAEEIEDASLRVERLDEEWTVVYGDVRLPLAPGSLADDADAPTGDDLAQLLWQQHYVLGRWEIGLRILDHRRFFDVTTLIGVRVEDADVFEAVHQLPLRWFADGDVDGLRVDHVDGLADPVGYLHSLAAAAPGAWLCIEKILVGDEQLDPQWPVDGTTGYDALADLTDVLIDPSARPAIDALFAAITGDDSDVETIERVARAEVVDSLLRPEVRRCAADLRRVAIDRGIDLDEAQASAAVEAFVAEMPVYRTYALAGRTTSARDRQVIVDTVERVLSHHEDVLPRAVSVLADVVLQPADGPAADLCRRIQQLSGPAMAKGVEDTAFYRDTRFIALDEVGGGPDRFGIDVATFHERSGQRSQAWPRGMVTTSTHDTKRSEDVRARLAVLSEIPDEWGDVLNLWCKRSAGWWPSGGTRDPALEVLVHQTLVGAHPLGADRAHAYLEKAMREAKVNTSWITPNPDFEAAAHRLLDLALTDPEHVADVNALVARVLVPGRINSLAQKLLVLTMPGVPDLYQGTELWSLDLVDPDNRRPVDYDVRKRLLGGVSSSGIAAARHWTTTLADPTDPGTAKLAVVRHALELRRRRRPCFVGAEAGYEPIRATGPAAEHAVAFSRGGAVVTIVPRLSLRRELDGGWRDTTVELPEGEWTDVFTGASRNSGPTAVSDVLGDFPVALLERA
jgi:(1->4)-alpha-D-glucan 1-alpha-D-glucosylmutase